MQTRLVMAGIAFGICTNSIYHPHVLSGADGLNPLIVARPEPDAVDSEANAENTVDVKFMLRGYCFAASDVHDKNAFGFGPSDNASKEITSPRATFRKRTYLLAQPTVVTDFGKNQGMRLLLVNATKETLVFDACDSRLSIVQEAKDESGDWKPIEYLPSSWCGNSYHRVMLKPGRFWSFAAPRYKGEIATQLRFRLIGDDGKTLLLSNQFEGSINREQFTAKQPYNPKSVMEPYFPVSGN